MVADGRGQQPQLLGLDQLKLDWPRRVGDADESLSPFAITPAVVAVRPDEPPQADGTYVALGDSVAAPSDSSIYLFLQFLRTPEGGGLDTLYNRAREW